MSKRLFNVDLELTKVHDNTDMSKYYDMFSIGITTTRGRLDVCNNLYEQVRMCNDKIPISIIVNSKEWSDSIPREWQQETLIITDELISISKCRNMHSMLFPDRPYFITMDDDSYLMHPKAIDNVIYAHLETGFDLIRAWHNCLVSCWKGLLAEVYWWDERFYFGDEDTDFHMRLERKRVKDGLEYNKARFADFTINGHKHHEINNYGKEKLDGFTCKFNGKEMLWKKWGLKAQPRDEEENIKVEQLLPDIDFYPEFRTKFMEMPKLA